MSPTRHTSPESYDDIPSSPETKRKQGGRHRMFSNEQRKDRNRLAQAAFRERRSQYTKTLESTIDDLETIIRELQDSNRAASQQLDDTKEESDKLRQLLLTVINENHSLRRKMKSMNTAQKEQAVQYGAHSTAIFSILRYKLALTENSFFLSSTPPTPMFTGFVYDRRYQRFSQCVIVG